MDLTVDQAGFARTLRLIGRAVPSRPTLPVLQHVLLESGEGRLTLTATDLDVAITTSTPAEVAEPGRVLLPARLLGEFVSQLPSAPAGKTYELWVIQGDRVLAAGLFPAGKTASPVLLARRVPKGAHVGVSIERSGGVDQPTHIIGETTPI